MLRCACVQYACHFDSVFFNMYVKKHNSAVPVHVNMGCQYSSTLGIEHGQSRYYRTIAQLTSLHQLHCKRNPREIQVKMTAAVNSKREVYARFTWTDAPKGTTNSLIVSNRLVWKKILAMWLC